MADFLSLGVTFIVAGAGAYLGSYLKKKGENLATHEDIDKLVIQMSAVTKATKEIETQISDIAWSRQRRWEVTKDTLFELVKALGDVMEALTQLDSTIRTVEWMKNEGNEPVSQAEALDYWVRASSAFSRASLLSELVSGPEVRAALNMLNVQIRILVGDMFKGNLETFRDSLVKLVGHQTLFLNAVRKELGIEVGQPEIR